MKFEQAKAATETAETEEQYQQMLDHYMFPGKIKEQELTEAMSKIFPDDDVMVTDPEEREKRSEISENLREAMSRYLRVNFEVSHTRKKPEKQLPRVLAEDTLLNLPHNWQDKEYERRLDILTNGTAAQKKELLFSALHEAKEGYTREKLLAMTDEEIANDFENLDRLHGFVDAARSISQMQDLELTEAEQKELLDFEKEFDAASFLYIRAKLIANPLYSMVRAESLPKFDDTQVLVEDMTENAESAEALRSLLGEAADLQEFVKPVLQNTVANLLATDVPADQIMWYGADGKELKAKFNAKRDTYDLPVEDLYQDGRLTAVLPDGTVKEINISHLEGGGMQEAARERSVAPYIDKSLPDKMASLSAALDAADPWYIRSSKQFKAVQAEMKKLGTAMHKLGSHPTKFQQDTMRAQMLHLQELCTQYVDYKHQQSGELNEREAARVEAVTNIQKYMTSTLQQLDTLAKYTAASDNAQEKEAFQQAYSAEAREKNHQAYGEQLDQAAAFQRTEPQSGVQREKTSTMFDRMNKAKSYENIACPPSQECGDALEKLHRDLRGEFERMFTAAERKSLTPAEQAKLRHDMAKLTVFHLVLTERGGDKFTGHAGQIEQALAKNGEKLISSVENLPKFSQCIGEITPQRVEAFLMKDGAREVGQELIKAGLNQAKAPAQPAPENNMQKDMQNPMQK